MPELPEVEILRTGLTKYISGLTISKVAVRNVKSFQGSSDLVVGGKVKAIRRFGKMLVVDLSNGYSLVIHVKMTGRLIYRGKKLTRTVLVDEDLTILPNKHTHVVFSFKNGDVLYFNDVRKFGWVKVVRTTDVTQLPFVKQLGPEPFKDLTKELFFSILQQSSRPVKTLLMDQQRISGVGNIYANEALFCAKVLPKKSAKKIRENEAWELFRCVGKVLRDGMKYGGSSIDSFRDVLGQRGTYQKHYFVYNREKLPCRRNGCKGTIEKVALSGRGTYYCPVCQF